MHSAAAITDPHTDLPCESKVKPEDPATSTMLNSAAGQQSDCMGLLSSCLACSEADGEVYRPRPLVKLDFGYPCMISLLAYFRVEITEKAPGLYE